MSVTKLGPNDLLHYNPHHNVLICQKCQYAIQKSALESHLLKHKIYREERQNLLSTISRLDLLEPEEVPLPTPESPPIDGLPILHGYRCSVHGGGTLFASERRMKQHQREIHGGDSSCFAHTVKLQTFFRGTKIRYFEVTEVDSTRCVDTPGNVSRARNENTGNVEMTRGEEVEQASPKCFSVKNDLETLTYFYHFTTTTSLTFPSTGNPQFTTHYWQTDIVLQTLQHRWLICGLLALSASHLAALTDDTTTERVHLDRSGQLYAEFKEGWSEAGKRNLGVISPKGDVDAMEAGEQIDRVLSCLHWNHTPSELISIITTLRRFVNPNPTLFNTNIQSSDCNHDHEQQMDAFAKASRVTNSSNFPTNGRLTIILNHLTTLPSRMTEVLGKPDSPQGVLATIPAIAILVECCEVSFASDDKEAAFKGMTRWLEKISGHFNHMVATHDPAALVVLAHWAGFLVERAEQCGCWFLKGLARNILMEISECFPVDAPAVFGLIKELMR